MKLTTAERGATVTDTGPSSLQKIKNMTVRHTSHPKFNTNHTHNIPQFVVRDSHCTNTKRDIVGRRSREVNVNDIGGFLI